VTNENHNSYAIALPCHSNDCLLYLFTVVNLYCFKSI